MAIFTIFYNMQRQIDSQFVAYNLEKLTLIENGMHLPSNNDIDSKQPIFTATKTTEGIKRKTL